MAIVRAAAEMVLVTSRQWRTGYSLSRTIFVWENLCAGILNHFKVFIVFVSGCNWFLPLKKEERKQSLPLPYLNLYKDAILADFFSLGMLFGREFTSPSTPQVLCGPSLTAAPSQPTITQLFPSSYRHGCRAVIGIV